MRIEYGIVYIYLLFCFIVIKNMWDFIIILVLFIEDISNKFYFFLEISKIF